MANGHPTTGEVASRHGFIGDLLQQPLGFQSGDEQEEFQVLRAGALSALSVSRIQARKARLYRCLCT